MILEADTAAPTGVTESQIGSIPLNGSDPASNSPQDYPVHVLCSINKNKCPSVEIVDVERDSVISEPAPGQSPPTQTTVVGKLVHLEVRYKEGTGQTGTTYELDNDHVWTIDGHQDTTIVEDYDIEDGELDLLPDPLHDEEIEYYYVRANNGYNIEVEAELEEGDVTHRARATARYNVTGPTNVALGSTTVPGLTIDTWGTPQDWLSFGHPFDSTAAGMWFDFTATPPAGGNGHVAATQLVSSTVGGIPRAGHPPAVHPGTNGEFWLDACAIYEDARTATGGQFRWKAWDSPAAELSPSDSIVSWVALFKTYFMYRPSGAESIWVPIGRLNWQFQGTVIRGSGGAWTGPHGASKSVTPLSSTSEFPQWDEETPWEGECDDIPDD